MLAEATPEAVLRHVGYYKKDEEDEDVGER
jgi:hypothetical protein